MTKQQQLEATTRRNDALRRGKERLDGLALRIWLANTVFGTTGLNDAISQAAVCAAFNCTPAELTEAQRAIIKMLFEETKKK